MKSEFASTHTMTFDTVQKRNRWVQWRKDKRRCAVAQFMAQFNAVREKPIK